MISRSAFLAGCLLRMRARALAQVYEEHVTAGGSLVEFTGYAMPLQYKGKDNKQARRRGRHHRSFPELTGSAHARRYR